VHPPTAQSLVLSPPVLVARHRPPDRVLAIIITLAALALYVSTMLPGLGGPEDTPKFQLLGIVLGTAHAPGYPLYVMIGHAFSWLPVGTPAWRANFMSAVFGAITVGLIYLLLARLGASRVGAIALALGFAAGRYFWWDAIVAEVYTLAAALQAAAVLSLVNWSTSRRPRDFFASVGLAALALGNHLSIVAVVPVLVLFTALTDWRFAFRLRTMAVTVGLVLLGLSSYLFIAIRTYQGAGYLESRFTSLSGFWYVLRGGRFDDVMFAFSGHELLTERLPLVLGLLLDEFTWPGVALVLTGLGIAAWRAPRLALLLAGGALCAIGLALNFDSDLKGFLVPAFVMAWPLAAFAVRGDGGGRPVVRHAVTTAATLMALAVPVRALVVNLPHNNLRGDVYFGLYFETLREWAPERAAFVVENYTVDSMLEYQYAIASGGKRLAELVPREAEAIEARLDDGQHVFAFSEGADDMAALGFRLEPVSLPGQSIADRLRRPGADAVVVAGVWPGLSGALGLAPGGPTVGSQLQAHVVVAASPGSAPLLLADSQPISRDLSALSPALTGLVAETSAIGGGRIHVGGLPVARTDSGIAVAVAARDGRLIHRLTFARGDPLRVPMDMSRLALYEVKGRQACDAIGHRRWTDVSALTNTGGVRLFFNGFHPFDASIALYVTARGPLRPVLSDEHGPGRPTMTVERYEAGDRAALERRLAEDGVPRPWPVVGSAVQRIEVRVNDNGQSATMVVGLGERGVHILARGLADRPEAWRTRVCEAQLPVLLSAPQALADLWVGSGAEVAFGAGWRGSEPGRDGPTRWMGDRRATVLASIDHRAASWLYLQVFPRAAGGTLTVTINGAALEPQELRAGWQVLSWPVPADMWALGPNQMSLETTVSPEPEAGDVDRRRRTVAVRRWRVEKCSVGSAGC
jgi:Protein of unknown function (DUF2723)